MFKIKQTDEGVELCIGTSDEDHAKGHKIIRFTHHFTFDRWIKFTDEVVEMAETIRPAPEREPISSDKAKLATLPSFKVSKPEPDLKGRADQIHEILEDFGPLSYEELGKRLYPPVDRKRITRLISQMIRDGVGLVRFGKPRQVRLK